MGRAVSPSAWGERPRRRAALIDIEDGVVRKSTAICEWPVLVVENRDAGAARSQAGAGERPPDG